MDIIQINRIAKQHGYPLELKIPKLNICIEVLKNGIKVYDIKDDVYVRVSLKHSKGYTYVEKEAWQKVVDKLKEVEEQYNYGESTKI